MRTFASSEFGRSLGSVALAIHKRPSDLIVEPQNIIDHIKDLIWPRGSAVERLLFDITVLAKASEEDKTVGDKIKRKRASWPKVKKPRPWPKQE